jgi:acetyl-CoA acetyltransferase
MTESGTLVVNQAAANADPRFVAPDDAFTIAVLMDYEAFGLCQRGHAYELWSRGVTSLDGDICVNPSGGGGIVGPDHGVCSIHIFAR